MLTDEQIERLASRIKEFNKIISGDDLMKVAAKVFNKPIEKMTPFHAEFVVARLMASFYLPELEEKFEKFLQS